MGVFGLASFVILKSLAGTSMHVAILQVTGTVASVFAIFYAEWMLGRDKRKFLLWFGILGRLTLLLMLFTTSSVSFLIVCALVFIFSPGIVPATNAILQANISKALVGKLYSVTISVGSAAAMLGTFVSGLVLEGYEKNYQWLFALAGVVGFIGIFLRSRIHLRRGLADPREKTLFFRGERIPRLLYRSIVVPLKHSYKVLAENPSFSLFERNFFIYGLAFMILSVVAPVFLVDKINISYSQVGINGFLFQLATIVSVPVFGLFYDKMNPAGFSRIVYVILAFYPLMLLSALGLSDVTGISPIIWVYIASLIFGTGMGGLSLVWSLGNLYFASNKDAAPFMGAHVTLVGLRGAIGPILGYIINRYFGPYPAFVLATLLFLTAAYLMHQLSNALSRASGDGRIMASVSSRLQA